jgi:heat-inducible transcriptional repressor
MPLQEIKPRKSAILRLVTDRYLRSGQATGSQTLSRELAELLGLELSPATIRSAMADLEDAGLLYSAHTSAGRLPTEAGLRLFVNNLLEVQPLDHARRAEIEEQFDSAPPHLPEMMERAGRALSNLSQCAGLVAAPKKDKPFRRVEFVQISATQVLAVWVAEDGSVENRILEADPALTQSDLQRASNYLNHHLFGRTLSEARLSIQNEIAQNRADLDVLTAALVEKGLALSHESDGIVIVRGQSNLLSGVREAADLERLRRLFDRLEQHETVLKLVERTASAEGVQIFIGAGNPLFDDSGCAMIIAPYKDKQQNVIGAIGVIGPTRLNYGRIIPMVDYTAKILSGA